MKPYYKNLIRVNLLALFLIVTGVLNGYATKHLVTVQNFSFSPSSMTINLGDTVTWQWVNGSHTTTSTTIPAGAASWSNSIDASHLTFSYVPSVLGTYNYKCNIHPTTMLASFTVVCPTAPTLTISAAGPTTFCKGDQVNLSKNSAGSFFAFQWKLDGVNIAGATTSSYTAVATGSYILFATNNCGTSSSSNGIDVKVNKKPKANVTPSGPLNICASQPALLTVSSANNQTYQWKKGNANISGATNTTLLVSTSGDYKCKVTKTNTGCIKTSKAVSVTVNPNCKAGEVKLTATAYPNPSQDYFVLNTTSLLLENGTIKIYDLTGKILESYIVTNENTSVGSNLPSGIYFAKVASSGQLIQVLKLIKN